MEGNACENNSSDVSNTRLTVTPSGRLAVKFNQFNKKHGIAGVVLMFLIIIIISIYNSVIISSPDLKTNFSCQHEEVQESKDLMARLCHVNPWRQYLSLTFKN